MSAEVIDLDLHRPVWRVVKGRCRGCGGGEAVSVQHEECPLDASECPACGAMLWAVTHYELADGSFEPRLEVAQ